MGMQVKLTTHMNHQKRSSTDVNPLWEATMLEGEDESLLWQIDLAVLSNLRKIQLLEAASTTT